MTRAALIRSLAERIYSIRCPHPTRVGIDGVDAAGKTTLGDELAAALRALGGRSVIRSGIDHFHHPAAVRLRRGADSPEGYYRDSFDHAALVESLLDPLGPRGSRAYRTAAFDYTTDAPVAAPVASAPDDAVLVYDGIFLHRPELRDYWDFSIFLAVGFDVTVARAERRDAAPRGTNRPGDCGPGDSAAVRARYEARYVPGQRIYLAACRPETRATVVIDNTDLQHPVERSTSGLRT